MSPGFLALGLLAAGTLILSGLVTDSGATPARQIALGGGDCLEDDASVYRWPGAAMDHAGALWLDSGTIDPRDGWTADGDRPHTGPSATLVWRPESGRAPWVAGFAVQTRAADGDHVGLHRDGPGASFGWLAGRRLGAFDVAATWRSVYGGWSSDDDARDEFEHHRDDVGVGLRRGLSSRAWLDVAGDVRRQRNRVQAPGDPAAWDTGNQTSWRSWSLRARAFAGLGERTVLSLAGERVREDFAGPVVGPTWEVDSVLDQDNRLWRLAAALTRLPDPDRLLSFTAEYLRVTAEARALAGSADAPANRRARTFSLRLAAERRVNWWLSLRGSLAVTARADEVELEGRRLVDAAGGFALHLGVWSLDTTASALPAPEAWRWLLAEPRRDLWLRATVRREF